MGSFGFAIVSPSIVLLYQLFIACFADGFSLIKFVALTRGLQRAWFTAGILCLVLNGLGTLVAAILAFHYRALIFIQIQQESPPYASNRIYAMGGER